MQAVLGVLLGAARAGSANGLNVQEVVRELPRSAWHGESDSGPSGSSRSAARLAGVQEALRLLVEETSEAYVVDEGTRGQMAYRALMC